MLHICNVSPSWLIEQRFPSIKPDKICCNLETGCRLTSKANGEKDPAQGQGQFFQGRIFSVLEAGCFDNWNFDAGDQL